MSTSKATLKRVYVEVDDETLLTLSFLYKKELSETADLPSQSFTLRMLREVFKSVQHMYLINCSRSRCEDRLEEIKGEIQTFLAEISADDFDLIGDDLMNECFSIDQELQDLSGGFIAGYLAAYMIEKDLFQTLCSEDSDDDIIGKISSKSKLIEEIYHNIASFRNQGEIVLRRYRDLRYRLLSLAVEN